jgi:hypothetical protein
MLHLIEFVCKRYGIDTNRTDSYKALLFWATPIIGGLLTGVHEKYPLSDFFFVMHYVGLTITLVWITGLLADLLIFIFTNIQAVVSFCFVSALVIGATYLLAPMYKSYDAKQKETIHRQNLTMTCARSPAYDNQCLCAGNIGSRWIERIDTTKCR